MIRYFTLKAKHGLKIVFLPLVIHVVLGVLAGVFTAVAYKTGINIFNVHPEAKVGEGLVFAIAAIGAIGSGRLVSRLLPKHEPDTGTEPGADPAR